MELWAREAQSELWAREAQLELWAWEAQLQEVLLQEALLQGDWSQGDWSQGALLRVDWLQVGRGEAQWDRWGCCRPRCRTAE